METGHIEGYRITEHITVAGNTFVMGHNPKEPEPYGTWIKDEDIFMIGHYFSSETDARQDLFKRALHTLPEQEQGQIAVDNLREEDIATIIRKGREEDRLADIEACLHNIANKLPIEKSKISTIMEDPSFIGEALNLYLHIDPSAELEALKESLTGDEKTVILDGNSELAQILTGAN